jgi:hypothetical protein
VNLLREPGLESFTSNYRFAYAVTTWSGAMLDQTLASIPPGERVLVVDSRRHQPLSKSWNVAIDTLLWDEGYDACIVMNDDVVLRDDTGMLLAWGLLEGQHQLGHMEEEPNPSPHEDLWPPGRPELLLLSARHASPSPDCTDLVDQQLLQAAQPRWQPGPDFSCFCVSRRLGQVVGRFDEGFIPCWFEDNDMHRRIQLAGYEAGALAPYWHFRNGTTRTDGERSMAVRAGAFENSKRYYSQKWGAPYDQASPIGRETFLHPFGVPEALAR